MSDPTIGDLLSDAPTNWGRWGEDDEIGAANLLDTAAVLRGVSAVETGDVYTLGLPINHPEGDPVARGTDRTEPEHTMERDRSHYAAGEATFEGTRGLEYADDVLRTYTHATTHVDALGHVWYDGELYNGYPAETTTGGLDRCDVRALGEHGLVGRAVLLDVARHRGVERLEAGVEITVDELEACADAQGCAIGERDVLLVRTGYLEAFHEEGPDALAGDPGLTAADETLAWFADRDLALLGTDTFVNEQVLSDETGTLVPLHGALLRDQGVVFAEMLALGELAAACADRGDYGMLFVCSPLKIDGGSGSPVNPVAIT